MKERIQRATGEREERRRLPNAQDTGSNYGGGKPRGRRAGEDEALLSFTSDFLNAESGEEGESAPMVIRQTRKKPKGEPLEVYTGDDIEPERPKNAEPPSVLRKASDQSLASSSYTGQHGPTRRTGRNEYSTIQEELMQRAHEEALLEEAKLRASIAVGERSLASSPFGAQNPVHTPEDTGVRKASKIKEAKALKGKAPHVSLHSSLPNSGAVASTKSLRQDTNISLKYWN